MRLAGTANQYSTKAMPQLAITAIHRGEVLNFKCPYHAKVMNTFEAISSRMGAVCGLMGLSGIASMRARPALFFSAGLSSCGERAEHAKEGCGNRTCERRSRPWPVARRSEERRV